jgi:hypothetical protein
MPLDLAVLLEHFGDALAVGGAVVDDGDLLQLERVGRIQRQAAPSALSLAMMR